MRIHKLLPILLALGTYPALAADNHEHPAATIDQPANGHHPEGNLLEQLGYSIMTVEDQTVAGKSVVAIPIQAIFVENGKTFVLAQNDKDPENYIRWEVELGRNDGQLVETKSGVFPGDKIIIKMADLIAYRQSTGTAAYPKDTALANATQTPPQSLSTPSAQPATVPAPVKAAVEKPIEKKANNYEIQIGAFSKEESAKRIAEQLKANYGKTGVLVSQSKGRPLYLVRVGDFTSFRTAQDTKEKLITTGYPEAFVVSSN